MRRFLSKGVLLAGVLALISCGGRATVPQSTGKSMGSAGTLTLHRIKTPSSCYSGDNGTPYTTSATITFYGWPDNSPPGNAIAHPVIHSVASGDGSYCNPTTFATEPTASENSKFPYGVRIYVPFMQKYFIREDDCTASGPSSGSGSNGCSGTWFDLWIGGDANSNFSNVIACEQKLTPGGQVSVIIHPNSSEPVAWIGAIFNDPNSCNQSTGKGTPTPSPTGSPKPTPTPNPTTKPSSSPSPQPTSSPNGTSSNVTFYGWPDNGDSCAIAHPVIHKCAGGTGTWSNPITFATSTSNNSTIPYGSIIYVPFLQRYFIREDDCGSGACTGWAVNLWVGGNSSDNPNDVIACENYLTPNGPVNVVYNPPSNEPVTNLGQIWNESNGECNGSYNYSNARVKR